MRALLAALLLIGARAAAAVADQDWVGTISCSPIPGFARVPLRQPFRLEVRGGVARYQRSIRIADTSMDSGSSEQGQGAVGVDGRVALEGNGALPGSSYHSEFSGVLGASGQARLEGVQHWRFSQRPNFDRGCRLDLVRQPR